MATIHVVVQATMQVSIEEGQDIKGDWISMTDEEREQALKSILDMDWLKEKYLRGFKWQRVG